MRPPVREVRRINVAGVYSFGAPKIGNKAFKANYDKVLGSKTFRWVYSNDGVAKLPVWGAVPIPSTPAPFGDVTRRWATLESTQRQWHASRLLGRC